MMTNKSSDRPSDTDSLANDEPPPVRFRLMVEDCRAARNALYSARVYLDCNSKQKSF
jgi:hypothetical protein